MAVALAEDVVVAADPRSRRLAPRDEEAFSSHGILSLRKKRGVDHPVQARASMPAALSRLPVIWYSPTSRIDCLRSRPIPASRFSIWQPESRTPGLQSPLCLMASSTLLLPALLVAVAAAEVVVVVRRRPPRLLQLADAVSS